VICHPGTHGKWILVEDGRIVRFVSFMTGELFAVLTRHSVLRSDAPADDADAFAQGLQAAGDGGALAARLFSTRSRVVGGTAPARSTPSYLSGVLIGAEVAAGPAALGVEPDAPVDLLGEPNLCALYRRALERRGVACAVHDGGESAVAGLWALHRLAAG
jgi:2-dehydro-3-deoxygalactonokinase